jgi:hypothetical protein
VDLICQQTRLVEEILSGQEKVARAAPFRQHLNLADVMREVCNVLPRNASREIELRIAPELADLAVVAIRVQILPPFTSCCRRSVRTKRGLVWTMSECRVACQRDASLPGQHKLVGRMWPITSRHVPESTKGGEHDCRSDVCVAADSVVCNCGVYRKQPDLDGYSMAQQRLAKAA